MLLLNPLRTDQAATLTKAKKAKAEKQKLKLAKT
jgi:hypothetical protein